jgi:hypothetical protein
MVLTPFCTAYHKLSNRKWYIIWDRSCKLMNKISRILMVAVIITCLFAGVAAANSFEVRKTSGEHQGDSVEPGRGVKVTTSDGREHFRTTDRDRRIKDINPENKDDVIGSGDDCISDENGDGDFNDDEDEECITIDPTTPIPEFPTVALPIAAVIGMVFMFQNRKNKE